jgi:hypothetical protein
MKVKVRNIFYVLGLLVVTFLAVVVIYQQQEIGKIKGDIESLYGSVEIAQNAGFKANAKIREINTTLEDLQGVSLKLKGSFLALLDYDPGALWLVAKNPDLCLMVADRYLKAFEDNIDRGGLSDVFFSSLVSARAAGATKEEVVGRVDKALSIIAKARAGTFPAGYREADWLPFAAQEVKNWEPKEE